MKPQRFKRFVPCGGVNQVLMPKLGDANIINNCRYVSEDGWLANVGFESWWKLPSSWTVAAEVALKYLEKKVDAVFQWKRQGTTAIYTFVEQNARLYYVLGNKDQASPGVNHSFTP